MKIPCEIVVWYVLPMIRRELSKELVYTHGMTQAEVARRFGVTDAAISQYLKKKRGGNSLIDDNPLLRRDVQALLRRQEDGAPGDNLQGPDRVSSAALCVRGGRAGGLHPMKGLWYRNSCA